MLFAPLPPPVGGIASIAAMLHRELGTFRDILFVQPAPKTTAWTRIVRPLISVGRLVRGTLRVRPSGRVVFFCSSRASFWEKCVWTALVLALGRTAVVVMVAGDFPESFAAAPRWARELAQRLFRHRRVLVAAQSESWAARYGEMFPRAAITQIGATVDPEFFCHNEPRHPVAYPLTVLYVGWVIEDKGVIDLLDAIQSLASALTTRARVRLVGPVFGREAFWQAEIDRRGIASHVELAGPVMNRSAMLEEYRNADIFVFPSHFEGFPVALLEATASALPCIATNVGGIPDILDGGRSGILVPPHAPSTIATALDALISNADERQRLGKAAGAHTRRAFSLDACVASYERALGLR